MTESRFDRATATALSVGVAISAALVAIGFGLSFLLGWTGTIRGADVGVTSTTDFSNLVERLVALQPLAIVQAGLIVLVATPVMRVAITVLGFWRQHDRLYVAVSLLVLALLFISLGFLH